MPQKPLIAGVTRIKDEADVIRLNLAHHLRLGIRHFVVIDNGSTDGTFEEVERFRKERPDALLRLGIRSEGPLLPERAADRSGRMGEAGMEPGMDFLLRRR
ncbi:MAG: hypothetical protein COV76_06525 [Candidatus Omnitrophica bacterium CG11_big_fil_rev_8_21_14_0_20_64_10]|nr:MAG: hypothetical protein COV76_06525 [Candidatus Omnitrophica bacterium CG11_big_fil_rev_8_21_14_0_20_64_10]